MDPAQGLCLGALFDIAATNVNINPSSFLKFLIFQLYLLIIILIVFGK